MQVTAKQFDIWTAPKSYRYKEEAIYNHAPQNPGIYSLVTFPEGQEGKTLYMGLVEDRTIYDALFEHWRGERQPAVQDLLAKYPNLYFGYVLEANAQGPEDWKDLFWALAQQDKPELMDLAQIKPTGRYSDITVKDKSLL